MEPKLNRIIRLAELPDFVGIKRTQIEYLISQGKFPIPVKLSARARGWISSEIEEWQNQRIAERDRKGE